MNITIGSNLIISNGDKDLFDSLKTQCTGPNPAYLSFQRMILAKPRLRYAKNLQPDVELFTWKELNGNLIVPRGLFDQIYGPGVTVTDLRVAPSAKLALQNVTLRPDQADAVITVTSFDNGVLVAPTGSGKTIMGLAIAVTQGCKTLFIVHTKGLLNQTVKEVEKRLGVTPGIIGDGKFEVKDFTVAMIQTLTRRDLTTIKDAFGTIIFDECHHTPAKSFMQVCSSFNAKYIYGLSATPSRGDGLSWVMYQLLGPERHRISSSDLQAIGAIIKPTIVPVITPYIPLKDYDPFAVAEHLDAISKDTKRNDFVIDFVEKNLGKQTVLLTERVDHVEYLSTRLAKYSPTIYHGQLSKKDKEIAESSMKSGTKLTIATYASIGEGFDVPVWEQLFLITPFSSATRVIQVLGRISRASVGKTSATVFDFVDANDSLLASRYEKRQKAYATV